jgi:hypothetical protein
MWKTTNTINVSFIILITLSGNRPWAVAQFWRYRQLICTIQIELVITTNLKFAFVTMTKTLITAGHHFVYYVQSYRINVPTHYVVPKNIFLTFLLYPETFL